MINPADRFKNLKAIADSLTRSGIRKLNKVTKSGEQFTVLSAPALAGMCIADAIKNQLLNPATTLNILIIGAKHLEVTDGCEWFRFLPFVLSDNSIKKINITVLMQPKCNFRASRFCELVKPNGVVSTKVIYDSLDDFCIENPNAAFDIAIDFAVTFSAAYGIEYLKGNGLRHLLSKGIPVYFSGFCYLHDSLNRTVAELLGYKTKNILTKNPFEMLTTKPNEAWGRTISRFETAVPEELQQFTEDQMDNIEVATLAVMQSLRNGYGLDPITPGELVKSNQDDELMYVMENLYLSIKDKTLLSYNSKSSTFQANENDELAGFLSSLINMYSAEWGKTERFFWACGLMVALRHNIDNAA